MKAKMWEIRIGNYACNLNVIAPDIKQAIAKAEKIMKENKEEQKITKAELIATED